MKDDDKPNRRSEPIGKTTLAITAPAAIKLASELPGIPVLGAATSALVDMVNARMERTRERMRQESEKRLTDFYSLVLTGDSAMDEEVARVMVDDQDFHALLRACAADIEAEKVEAYAQLARGIASGSVPKEWRRHFILSLRDLAAGDLERLRGALVAKEHDLIPARGPSMGPAHFLDPGEPGTTKAISVGNLAIRGFTHAGALSTAGERFARACLRPERLTPKALGYQAWSGHHFAILNYEMGNNRSLDALAEKLQDALRSNGVKSSVVAFQREEPRARLLFTMGVLIVELPSDGLARNLPHLASFAAKVPTLVVDVVGQAGDLPGVPLFARVSGSGRDTPLIVDDVLRLCAEKLSQGHAPRP